MAEREFDKPLDTRIDEEVEVERTVYELDKDKKTITPKTIKETIIVPTIYSKKKKYSDICPDYNHSWTVPDRNKWVAVCTKCPKRVYLDPLEQTVVDGKIINRLSRQQIR